MVKIVTDSVASIPAEVVRERDIEVVSLFVNRDGREYREADMDVDAFYEDIADMIDNPPTSSQPSQHAMETIFEKAAQAAAPAEIKEGASADVLEGLEKLENLCEAGILTEEELASFKQRAAEKTAAADAASPDNGASSDKTE